LRLQENLRTELPQKGTKSFFQTSPGSSVLTVGGILVEAELRGRHWSEAELARRRKGDPEKVKLGKSRSLPQGRKNEHSGNLHCLQQSKGRSSKPGPATDEVRATLNQQT
jgi:hypothetical protein